jgi:hypothetical protein
MAVTEAVSPQPEIKLIAFSGNGTKNPDAVVMINLGTAPRELKVRLSGTTSNAFDADLTNKERRYQHDGVLTARDGAIVASLPGESVMTLFARDAK